MVTARSRRGHGAVTAYITSVGHAPPAAPVLEVRQLAMRCSSPSSCTTKDTHTNCKFHLATPRPPPSVRTRCPRAHPRLCVPTRIPTPGHSGLSDTQTPAPALSPLPFRGPFGRSGALSDVLRRRRAHGTGHGVSRHSRPGSKVQPCSPYGAESSARQPPPPGSHSLVMSKSHPPYPSAASPALALRRQPARLPLRLPSTRPRRVCVKRGGGGRQRDQAP